MPTLLQRVTSLINEIGPDIKFLRSNSAFVVRWNSSSRTWGARPAGIVWGVTWLSTNDSTAAAPGPSSGQLVGDRWIRLPGDSSTPHEYYWSGSTWITFFSPITTAVPAAPAAPSVYSDSGTGSLLVSWSVPYHNGSPITGYDIQTFAGATAGPVVSVANVASVLITGLTNGTAYTAKVRAKNAIGNGDYSAASTAVSPIAPTATVYFDPSTSVTTRTGTQAAPYKTVAEVNANVSKLTAGSILYVNRGTTVSGSLNLTTSGTSSRPINIFPYGTGAQPKFTGSSDVNVTFGASNSTTQGSWYKVYDCDFDNGGWAGTRTYGQNVTYLHCTMRNSVVGVHVEGQYTKVIRCLISNNNRMSVNTQTPTNDDSGAFGVLLGTGGSNSEVAGCYISGHNATSFDYGMDGAAVEVSGANNSYIHHNEMVDNETGSELATCNYTRIEFNIIRGTYSAAKALVTRDDDGTFGAALNTTFSNNSVYFTGTNSMGVICGQTSRNILTAQRNIIQSGAKAWQSYGPVTENDNVLFSPGGSTFGGGYVRSTTTVLEDPLYFSYEDLTLRPGSPGISRKAGAYGNPPTIPASLALYRFNENSGTSSASQGTSAISAIVHGGWTTVSGRIGVIRTTASRAASMPATVAPASPTSMTIAIWTNVTNTTQDYQQFVLYNSSNNDIAGLTSLGGYPAAWFRTTSEYVRPSGPTAMTAGWHHMAGVFDNGSVMVYVDGVVVATATAELATGSNVVPTSGSINANFGGESWSSASAAQACDDAFIVMSALSQAQIQALMAAA